MSELTIDEETTGEVTVLAPRGRIDTQTAKSLETVVLGAVAAGRRRLVFDLSAVDYISSAGLRVILLGGKRLKELGGTMALCGLSPTIRDVFEISGFLRLFKVTEHRAEAEAAVSS